ncbi:aminodeoxychorismate synthase component I [soil metagenome]
MFWDKAHPLLLDRPEVQLIGDARGAILKRATRTQKTWNDPLEALGALIGENWIGYLSFDLGRRFETLPAIAADRVDAPLFIFGQNHRDMGVSPMRTFPPRFAHGREARATRLRSTFTLHEYLNAVQRVIDYIAAGDVYQVNLAQIFTTPQCHASREVFDRLQSDAPPDFGAFLSFEQFDLISNSPELLFRVTSDRKIITRPIKGTRPRGAGMERELLESKKDQAELAMIVDLERNDLGRICEVGSVRVTEPRIIEAHPTVYHGVATIEGQLRDDVGFVDILRAMFPCGSVTGAPKIRAMQIIDELEPVRRGPYCGAIGYIAADGTMEFNVAIRTMIVKDGLVHIPVGGGIVADSKPDDEYEETLVKARAMFAALGIDESQFRSDT